MGNLTRDPETKTLPNAQTTVCNFSLAVNRTWKDTEGNAREEVLFIDCSAFGAMGDTIGQYLRKGRALHVEGRLKLERWEQDGQNRSKVRVIVEQFRFVDSGRAEGQPGNDGAEARAEGNPATARENSPPTSAARERAGTHKGRATARKAAPAMADTGDDEVPF